MGTDNAADHLSPASDDSAVTESAETALPAEQTPEDTATAQPGDHDSSTDPAPDATATEDIAQEEPTPDDATTDEQPADDITVDEAPAGDEATDGQPADGNNAPPASADDDTTAEDGDPALQPVVPVEEDPADYTVMAAKIKVIFDFQGHGSQKAITKIYGSDSLIEPTEDLFPKEDGYCLLGWFRDPYFYEPWIFETDRTPSKGSLTLYARWVKTCTLTFDLQGKGENIIYTDFPADCLVEETEELKPTAENYRFDGWYRSISFEEGERWDFTRDVLTGDTTLYAKWTACKTYTVTFDLQGHGENIVKANLPEGNKLKQTADLTPIASGYRFLGWYKTPACADEDLWDFENGVILENTTLYAKWEEVTYTVRFDLQGRGTEISPRTVREDSLIEQTAELQPTAEGFHFENWYKDAAFTEVWDFSKDTVTCDITLYAKWHELAAGEYVVAFHTLGHGADSFQYMIAGSKLEEEAVKLPDETEYRFLGWYKSAACADSEKWNYEQDTVTGELHLYAKWEEIFYTVTFDLGGKGTNITRSGLKPGSKIEQTPDLTPKVESFLFLGWYQDADFTQAWDFATDTVWSDLTIYAAWKPYYTVTFDLLGKGANIVKPNILEGSLIEQTAELQPTAEGAHFENWYRTYDAQTGEFSDVWDFEKDTVTANLTLYAKWKVLEAGEYVVTYKLNGHGVDFFDYCKEGAKITRPEDPSDDGYLFLGWYEDATLKSLWDFAKDTVRADMTLYAKWKDITTLQISAVPDQPYTGKAIKPAVTIYTITPDDTGETDGIQTILKNKKDYTIKYFNNTNTNALLLQQGITAGTCKAEDTLAGGSNATGVKEDGGFNPALPYILVEGKGNYDGKIYMNFVISQIAIGDESNNVASGITLNCNDQLPIGTPKKDQKLIASLKYKAALKENQDYTAIVTLDGAETSGAVLSKDASIWAAGGDCVLTITGIGNYTGTIVRPVIVREKNTMLKNASLSLGAKCKSRSISTAGEDGVTLIPAWSEVVEEDVYDKNGDPVEDKNGNTKTKKVTYYYQYIDGQWKSDEDTYEYDYDDDGNEIVHKHKLDRSNAFTVKLGGEWLRYGDDFETSYTNNTEVGTATMTIIGKGAYTGSKSVNFKIKGASGKSFSSAVKIASSEDGGWVSKMTYTGGPLTQSVSLVSKASQWVDDEDHSMGKEPVAVYEEGTDYTVTYTNNVNVGTATATFTALPGSGFSGSFKKTFKIVGINMAEFVTFEGEGETLSPVIEETEKEVYIGKDEDGEKMYDTVVTRKVIATRKLDGTRPYASAGATLNFTLTSDIATLVQGKDYTIAYKNNKSITPWKTKKWREKWQEEDENGKLYWEYGDWEYEDYPVDGKMGTLTITGKGNYSGKLTIKYVIVAGALDTDNAVITVARSEYNPKTKTYKPKVTVWTEGSGYLSSKEYSVTYANNTQDAVAKYRNGEGEAPTVTVTYKKSNNYTNLRDEKDDEGNITARYEPISSAPVTMEFYDRKLTANNLYIIIDNDNPRELVYSGSQVTNVNARIYYGADTAIVKAAKADAETNHRLLTDPDGSYRLTLLTESDEANAGDYTLAYGKNNAVGKNKGSFTISGIGAYGGSVTQKFTIYKDPVAYQIAAADSE